MKKSLLFSMLHALLYLGAHAQNDTLLVASDEELASYYTAKIVRELSLPGADNAAIYPIVLEKIQYDETDEWLIGRLRDVLTPGQADTYQKLVLSDNNSASKVFPANDLPRYKPALEGLVETTTNSQHRRQVIELNDTNTIREVMIFKSTNPPDMEMNDRNYSIYRYFMSYAWTQRGRPCFCRSLMKFNLDEIPVGSRVKSATL